MIPTLGLTYGPEVVVDPRLGRQYRQVRFPRSKRKRVRKKWRADPSNWSWVYTGPLCYEVGRPESDLRWLLIMNPPAKVAFDAALANTARRAQRAVEENTMRALIGPEWRV